MASAPTFIVDADLHGLVDGRLEAGRRADTLRRLAASPGDRARVEAWQGQNDLLRNAFAGVDREPLPTTLDLAAKPKLHCVAANDAVEPIAITGPSSVPLRPSARRRVGLGFATIALIATGLGGAWVMSDVDPDDPVTGAPPLRGSVETALAARSAQAVGDGTAAGDAADAAAGELPTTAIPDLRPAGFAFVGAESDGSGPASILFRYRHGRDRIVVSVAKAGADPASGAAASATPRRIGSAYSWRRRDAVYAIAGTVRPGRLRDIAVALLDRGAAR